MAYLRVKHFVIFLMVMQVNAQRFRRVENDDDDDTIISALRDVSNQTKADTLNLPANASTIRENITDTFSCENRTYGYYADVDNECQVFHVCLPSQTPSGRNVTYRWSFICPSETVFNQEALTCTRVADSIDCKDSPDFYHLNMEIGKETNKTEQTNKKENRKIQKRKQEKRKENFIMDNVVMTNVVRDIVHDELKDHLKAVELTKDGKDSPLLIEAVIESIDPEVEDVEMEQRREEEMDRMIMERNVRNARNMKRGSMRFKSDV
uniref:Chitin-binding type-2 domain-containing protein n=1 Tax=Heliothis virescens TaxID=7102 RepID=A0A2A4J555_HELVI